MPPSRVEWTPHLSPAELALDSLLTGRLINVRLMQAKILLVWFALPSNNKCASLVEL